MVLFLSQQDLIHRHWEGREIGDVFPVSQPSISKRTGSRES